MEKNRLQIYILLVFLSFIGCNSKSSFEINKKTIDDICYEVTVLPRDLFEKDDTLKIADLLYLKFTIYEVKNNMRIQELYKQVNYNNLLYYVNTKITEDFKIIQDDKEYGPLQVFFENNNRISNKLVFLIAFEKIMIKKDEDVSLKFDDKLFNNGIIKLKFKTI